MEIEGSMPELTLPVTHVPKVWESLACEGEGLMKELYRGYTIEVTEGDEPMDDSEGNIIPGSTSYQYMIFEGTEPDADMEEIVDMETGDESEECALSNAKSWIDSFIEQKGE